MRTAFSSIIVLTLCPMAFADLKVTFDATGMPRNDLVMGRFYGIAVTGDVGEYVESFQMELLDTSEHAWVFGKSSDRENNIGTIIIVEERFLEVLAHEGHPYREIFPPWATGTGDYADQVALNLLGSGIPSGREIRFDLEEGGSILVGGDFAGILQVTATSNLGYTDTAVLEFVSDEQSIAVLNLAPPIPEPSSWALAILAFLTLGGLAKKHSFSV